MASKLYTINEQANNFTLFCTIFFIIATIITIVIILISIIKYKKIDNINHAYLTKKRIPFFFGLKRKFAFFNTTLGIFSILILAFPIFIVFTNMWRSESGKSFLDQADELLESFYQESCLSLAENDVAFALATVKTAVSRADVISASIVGNGQPFSPGLEIQGHKYFLWATTKTLTQEQVEHNVSPSEQVKSLIPGLEENLSKYNTAIMEDLSFYIEKLKLQKTNNYIDINNNELKNSIESTNQIINKNTNTTLFSYPEFNLATYAKQDTKNYFFYRPLCYIDTSKLDTVVHGALVLELSVEAILNDIRLQRLSFVRTIFVIACIVIFTAVFSGSFLAYSVTRPLKELINGILLITNTKDKSTLTKNIVSINRFDELGVLSTQINELSSLLSQSAKEINDLVIGQDVQKMFIPLMLDSKNNKLSISHACSKGVEFFGYYAGVKTVSGDYFDYFKIDETHYIIIKCDVSGKGISAALIMVEIATMFLSYFKNWDIQKDGTNIAVVAEKISDFLVEKTIVGRFAAFTICLLDTETNEITVCNAGDNILHYYSAKTKKLESIQLKKSLVAGIMKQSEMPETSKYKAETFKLSSGDILFFYTDGIEDSQRYIHNKILLKGAQPTSTELEATSENALVETFNASRVKAITESIIAKKPWTLSLKQDTGESNFVFDFSKATGSIREIVLSIVACELFFRLSINPELDDSTTLVDATLDDTLKQFLVDYKNLATVRTRAKPNAIEYSNTSLQEQFDDIAILLVKIQ